MAEKSGDFRILCKNVRQQHQNQIGKLTHKAEAELEFLDLVREYMKTRAELETQHAKSLEKLSKTLAQRKFRKYLGSNPMPCGSSEEVSRSTYHSFTVLLQETENVSKKQTEMAEAIIRDISAIIKEFSKHKLLSLQKNVEYVTKYHQEIYNAYEETEKARLAYEKASKDADAAVKKYDDALKKPKSGLQSLKTLVTGKDAATIVQKLKSKSKQRSRELNEARNNYLLTLQALNRIQQLYDNEDVPSLLQKLDGQYYETLQNMFNLLAKVEEDVSVSVKASADALRSQFALINRPQETELFLTENSAIFKANPVIPFENIGADTIKDLVVDEITKISLGQRLGFLVTHDSMFQALQHTKEQELKGARQLVEVYLQNPSQGNAASPLELIQEVQNTIDLIKCQRAKLACQINTLNQLGVVAIMPPKPEEQAANGHVGTQKAKVLYSYATQKDDELAVLEGDEVEIVEPEKDAWIKAKHLKSGKVGLLPASYVQIIASAPASGNSKTVIALYASEEGELSFHVGDEILCVDVIDAAEEWWEGKNLKTNQEGVFPVLFTRGWEAVAAGWNKDMPALVRTASSISKKSALAQKRASMQSPSNKSPSIVSSAQSDGQSNHFLAPTIEEAASAPTSLVLYSYDATCEGELSIEEGEIITVTSTKTGNDQWWEGQGKKGKGQFPSNYVTLITPEKMIKVKALFDYEPMSPGDLQFRAGDIVTILHQTNQDWWDGELNGQKGSVPANYVEILSE